MLFICYFQDFHFILFFYFYHCFYYCYEYYSYYYLLLLTSTMMINKVYRDSVAVCAISYRILLYYICLTYHRPLSSYIECVMLRSEDTSGSSGQALSILDVTISPHTTPHTIIHHLTLHHITPPHTTPYYTTSQHITRHRTAQNRTSHRQ